ncbi:MAG: CpsB/CapC family capsule biosynthesis tyrosine phosphatase [Calditrichia bacterium]
MIDLHSHFLYGVDDGARTSDTTVQMLAQAESVGISKLLATPHVNELTTPIIAHQIKETFHAIFQLMRRAGISIRIQLAGEVNLLSTSLDLTEYDWVLIGSKNKYILVETPFQFLPDRYSEILFHLRLKKIIPVLAHPERNIKLQNEPTQLINLIKQGCLVQVDAGSITGQFGRKCQRFAERLLHARAVHVVGSDAHDPRGRNYHVLEDAFKIVETEVDNSYAQLLFEQNPGKIWDGEKIEETSIDETALHASGWKKLMDVLSG